MEKGVDLGDILIAVLLFRVIVIASPLEHPVTSYIPIIILVVVALGVALYLAYFPRCPNCRQRRYKIVTRSMIVPGSELVTTQYDSQLGSYTRFRAEFIMTYKCPSCGHEWSQTVVRTIRSCL